MRFFFRSRQFKIIVAVFVAVLLLSGSTFLFGMKITPQGNLAATIAAPFQTAATKVKNAFSGVIHAYKDGNDLMVENAELEAEIARLHQQQVDYETAIRENEFYKDYLEIKDAHPDFTFTAANLISRDENDPFGGFLINRGSLDDVALHDPVITDEGLVGYISEVSLKTAKVTTVLSPDLTFGALDNRTVDAGIISGTLELSNNGLCKFYNLSRSSDVAIGDYVVTSGEGVLPAGLMVGTIESVSNDRYNTSIYANVKPFANLSELRNVMVITAFSGQGDLLGANNE